MRKNLLFIFLIIALIFYFLWYNSPEQKIKRNLKSLKKSIEKEELNKIDGKLASFFNYNEYYKEDALLDCEMFFDNYDKIRVEVKEIDVRVNKEEGVTTFKLRVLGRYKGYYYILVGGLSELERVIFYWKKEKKKWKIYGCRFPTLRYWVSIRPARLKRKFIKV